MTPLLRLALAVTLCGIALPPPPAAAYERTACKPGEKCKFLHWNERKVRVYLNQNFCRFPPEKTSLVTRDDRQCPTAIAAGLTEWDRVECSSMAIEYAGTTSRNDLGFSPSRKDNINLVTWASGTLDTSEMPPKGVFYDASAVIALTTATYDANTGKIVDMDMELNGEYFTFGVLDCGQEGWIPGVIDLQAVVTHESGHILGLADLYSPADQESTMYGRYEDGQDPCAKRTLSQDDIDGLCSIYPPDEGGCATQGPRPATLLTGLLALAILGLRRRGGTRISI